MSCEPLPVWDQFQWDSPFGWDAPVLITFAWDAISWDGFLWDDFSTVTPDWDGAFNWDQFRWDSDTMRCD